MSGGHAHGHDHGTSGAGNRRRLVIVLALTTTVLLMQIVGALLSGSLALAADAAHAGTDAAHIYGGLMATLTSWAEVRGIPYEGVPVGTIKRHATGKGNAPKEAMIAAARARGFSPADDNEADAIAILHWAIETNGGLG